MFGIAVFAFEGVGIYFNVRNSMQEPKKFKNVLLRQTHICVAMYIIMGIIGYMAFG